MAQTPVRYGKCLTDHKDGKDIRPGYRTEDYVLGPARPHIEAALARLGLPFPKDDEIFRGTRHDLLFLDSHGVVLRIGPMALDYLVNPGLLQPLGWISRAADSIDGTIGVAIYPGIEHYVKANVPETHDLKALRQFMDMSGQRTNDFLKDNAGIIRIRRGAQEVPVPVVLDIDNMEVGAGSTGAYLAPGIMDERRADGALPSQILKDMMASVSPTAQLGHDLLAAFEVHQPLRHMFWRAWHGDDGRIKDTPDAEQMNAFWDRCARLLQKPERVVMHEWLSRADTKGGKIEEYNQVLVDSMALYRTWTKVATDSEVKRPGARAIWSDYLARIEEKPGRLMSVPRPVQENREFLRMAMMRNQGVADFLPDAVRDDAAFIDSLQLEPMEKANSASERLRDDSQFMRPLIRSDHRVYMKASDRLRADRDFASDCLCINESVARELPMSLRSDMRFAMENIGAVPQLYAFLSNSLRADKTLTRRAVQGDPAMLEFAGAYQDNEEIVGEALRRDVKMYKHVSPRLQARPEVALEVIRSNGSLYKELPTALREDRDFNLRALQVNGGVYRHMADEDRNDEAIVRAAVTSYPEMINYTDAEWRMRPDIVKLCLMAQPPIARHMDSPLMSDPVFVLDMIENGGLRPEHLPQHWQGDMEFMVKVARLPGVRPVDIPFSISSSPAFMEMMRQATAGPDNERPVIERDGLRYVWIQNVRPDMVLEEDGKLRVGPDRLVIRDALPGPAKGGGRDMTGIYRLEK